MHHDGGTAAVTLYAPAVLADGVLVAKEELKL